MRTLRESLIRLIEANMAIAPDAKKLQIWISCLCDKPIVGLACSLSIKIGPVRDMRTREVDIDVIKEILAHEVVIALRVVMRQPAVLVEVIRTYLRKINVTLAIPLNELLIGAYRRGSCRQAQNRVWFENHLR